VSRSAPPSDEELRSLLRTRFAGTRPGPPDDDRFVGLPASASRELRHLIPDPTPAAVLVPIVDHPAALTVLLTERAAELRHHPGQISFPGGRSEPADAGLVATALRETEEEIGLDRGRVEVIGFLPAHLIITGYRVTPVVGFVTPGAPLRLDPTEVASVFEVPLRHVLDPANHRPQPRDFAGGQVTLYDITYGSRTIWGATAGMLITLYHFLFDEPDARGVRHVG